MKVMLPIFLSETIITIIMKFTHVMGVSFKKLRLFFHRVSVIINTVFLPLCALLYAGHENSLLKHCRACHHCLFLPLLK